jgi:hypothetical protein
MITGTGKAICYKNDLVWATIILPIARMLIARKPKRCALLAWNYKKLLINAAIRHYLLF